MIYIKSTHLINDISDVCKNDFYFCVNIVPNPYSSYLYHPKWNGSPGTICSVLVGCSVIHHTNQILKSRINLCTSSFMSWYRDCSPLIGLKQLNVCIAWSRHTCTFKPPLKQRFLIMPPPKIPPHGTTLEYLCQWVEGKAPPTLIEIGETTTCTSEVFVSMAEGPHRHHKLQPMTTTACAKWSICCGW